MLRVPVFAAFAFGLCLAYTGANEGLAQPLMYQFPTKRRNFDRVPASRWHGTTALPATQPTTF